MAKLSEAQKAARRAWYQQHKEHILEQEAKRRQQVEVKAYKAQYFQENKEAIYAKRREQRNDPAVKDASNAYFREYFKGPGKEKHAKRTKQYREANQEQFADYQNKYYAADPEKYREYGRKRYHDTKRTEWARHAVTRLRYKAKKRGLEFNLTVKYLESIIVDVCPILNLVLIYVAEGELNEASATIDRIDNSKGYIQGNVRIICHRANTMKSDADVETVKKLLEYMEGKR